MSLAASAFRRSAFLCTVLASLAMACSSADPTAPADGETTTATGAAQSTGSVGQFARGDHVGVHGMVLFGTGSDRLYLSHIPLYENPHNIQVVVEVKIDSGVPADQQLFGTKQFTFRPASAFSLGDLANGTLHSVAGNVFLGDFENGGTTAFRNVKFSVSRVVFQRAMTPTMAANPSLEYIAVGSPTQSFFVHLIDAPPSYDQILSVKLPADSLLTASDLEQGTLVRIMGQHDSVTSRLKARATVNATKLSDVGTSANGGPSTPVQILGENSCLPGDQFFGDCPAAQ
jgi:hypothetical protein